MPISWLHILGFQPLITKDYEAGSSNLWQSDQAELPHWGSTFRGTCAKALVHYPAGTRKSLHHVDNLSPAQGSGESCCLLSYKWWTFI